MRITAPILLALGLAGCGCRSAGARVAAAIARGDYAAAAAIAARTELPQPELDHALGQIILQAQVDPEAKTRPAESVEEGVRRIEAAALAGLEGAATSLRALFSTGLSNRGQNQKLAPDPELEQCWAGVEARKVAASRCVDQRRKR